MLQNYNELACVERTEINKTAELSATILGCTSMYWRELVLASSELENCYLEYVPFSACSGSSIGKCPF